MTRSNSASLNGGQKGRMHDLARGKVVCLGLVGLLWLWGCRATSPSQPILVFAASSMTEYVSALAKAFQTETGEKVQLSFASSSTLARQIEAGAPADIFLSANPEWGQFLANQYEPVLPIRPYLGNRMVLVAKSGSSLPERIWDWQPENGRIAIGNPEHVPAGKYAALGMRHIGIWKKASKQLVPTANVREALRLVLSGECDWGVVYSSDAEVANMQSIELPLPDKIKVEYTALCISCDRNGPARRFFEFLFSSRAQSTADTMGFHWIDSP